MTAITSGWPELHASSGRGWTSIPWMPAIMVGTAAIATQAEVVRMSSSGTAPTRATHAWVIDDGSSSSPATRSRPRSR